MAIFSRDTETNKIIIDDKFALAIICFIILGYTLFLFSSFGHSPSKWEETPRWIFSNSLRQLRRNLSKTSKYYDAMISKDELPSLGVFQHGSDKVSKITDSLESTSSIAEFEKYNYSIIVSVDFVTGNLYSGFTNVDFLKTDFQFHDKSIVEEWLSNEAKYLGHDILFRDAYGNPYIYGGDTILTFVRTLSSKDVELLKQFTDEPKGEY